MIDALLMRDLVLGVILFGVPAIGVIATLWSIGAHLPLQDAQDVVDGNVEAPTDYFVNGDESRDPEKNPWFRLAIAILCAASAYLIVDDSPESPPAVHTSAKRL